MSFCSDDTSHRKKSECFLSDALFTNSLNGRVLWGKQAQLRNLQRQRADGRARARVLTCTQSFCAGSPSAAPWTRGSWLPCLLLSAGGIPPSTCPGRVRVWRLSARLVCAVGNRGRTGNVTGDASIINTVNTTQTQLTSCPCHVTQWPPQHCPIKIFHVTWSSDPKIHPRWFLITTLHKWNALLPPF